MVFETVHRRPNIQTQLVILIFVGVSVILKENLDLIVHPWADVLAADTSYALVSACYLSQPENKTELTDDSDNAERKRR